MIKDFAFGKSSNQSPILENYNLFAFVGDAFCNSRLLENCLSFGNLPVGIGVGKIIALSMPKTEEILAADGRG